MKRYIYFSIQVAWVLFLINLSLRNNCHAQAYSHLRSFDFHKFRVEIAKTTSKKMARKINTFIDGVENSISQQSNLGKTPSTLMDLTVQNEFRIRRKYSMVIYFFPMEDSVSKRSFFGVDSLTTWSIQNYEEGDSNSYVKSTFRSQRILSTRPVIMGGVFSIIKNGRKEQEIIENIGRGVYIEIEEIEEEEVSY